MVPGIRGNVIEIQFAALQDLRFVIVCHVSDTDSGDKGAEFALLFFERDKETGSGTAVDQTHFFQFFACLIEDHGADLVLFAQGSHGR